MAGIDAAVWSAHASLTWDDFGADPNPAAYEDAHSHIDYDYTWTVTSEIDGGRAAYGIEGLQLHARLHRGLSWVRPSCRTESLLRHEQGHLDLAELLRRQEQPGIEAGLYKTRRPARGRNAEQQKQSAREDSAIRIADRLAPLLSKLAEARKRYDSETDYGADAGAQSTYDAKFAALRP